MAALTTQQVAKVLKAAGFKSFLTSHLTQSPTTKNGSVNDGIIVLPA